jgi:hypothetical protein
VFSDYSYLQKHIDTTNKIQYSLNMTPKETFKYLEAEFNSLQKQEKDLNDKIWLFAEALDFDNIENIQNRKWRDVSDVDLIPGATYIICQIWPDGTRGKPCVSVWTVNGWYHVSGDVPVSFEGFTIQVLC